MHVKVVSVVHCRTGSVGCVLKWFLLCTGGQGLLDAC